jgi:hypothetical protein
MLAGLRQVKDGVPSHSRYRVLADHVFLESMLYLAPHLQHLSAAAADEQVGPEAGDVAISVMT